MNDSIWHFVTCTWSKGSYSGMYLDGEAIWDTTLYNPDNVWDCNIMTVGGANQRTSRLLNGWMDDFYLYDTYFSAQDVADLYAIEITSITEVKSNNLVVTTYPNPAVEYSRINFSTTAGKNLSVNLINAAGSLVQNVYNGKSVDGKNEVEISTANINSGIYFIELNLDNHSTYTKLIIK